MVSQDLGLGSLVSRQPLGVYANGQQFILIGGQMS